MNYRIEKHDTRKLLAKTWKLDGKDENIHERISGLWKRIYTEFFPASSYEPVCGPTIEVYPGDDVYRPDYSFEVWVTVKKKK